MLLSNPGSLNSSVKTLSLAGLISALAYAYLAIKSQSYGQATLADLWLSCGIAFIICTAAWINIHRQSLHVSLITLIFWAIVFRIIGILSFPVLEDDFYRYLWDGYRLINDGTPYLKAPADFFSTNNIDPKFEKILDGINYPHIPTIYAPLTQWLFGLSYLIAPGEIWALQVLLVLFDLGLIFILLRLATAKYVILYAWNPLIIKEIAFTAHPDILGVFFLFAAFICLRRSIILAALFCGLAIASKVFAILIVPFLLRFNWRAWIVLCLTLSIVCAPFLTDIIALTTGLKAMAQLWLFNAPIYLLLLDYVSPQIIKSILLISFSVFWLLYYFNYLQSPKQNSPLVPRGDILFGVLFICISAFNPWYMIWLLPFAVIYPSIWAWAASAAVLFAYAIGLNLQDSTLEPYQQPTWAVILEFGLIALALVFDVLRKKTRAIN